MRLAAIGNSHLAAFKLGWDKVGADYPDLDVTFFGSTSKTLNELTPRNGALVAKSEPVRESLIWTSGGLDHVPGNFDRYLIVGMDTSFAHILHILLEHRPFELYDPAGDQQLISWPSFYRATEFFLGNSIASATIDKLRKITDAPILHAPNPYPAHVMRTRPEFAFLTDDLLERLFAHYSTAVDRAFAARCVFLPQPPETIEAKYFTRSEFARGSVKLRKGMKSQHPQDDYGHMNAEFGALCMRQVATRLASG